MSLLDAARDGKLAEVQALIRGGADVNEQSGVGAAALAGSDWLRCWPGPCGLSR